MHIRIRFRFLLIAAFWSAASHHPCAHAAGLHDEAFESTLASLCDKDVVLLGEASHGDGRTFEVKTRLVEQLITKCGFTGFFIESGIYDAVALNRGVRNGQRISAQMVSDVVGGIWSSAAEIRPLIDLLTTHNRRGTITIGGLDDQVSATAHFAHDGMITELTSVLVGKERDECASSWKQFPAWNYDAVTPFSPQVQANLRDCVSRMQASTTRATDLSVTTRDERLLFLSNLDRYASRQRADRTTLLNSRDQSMYLNLQWFQERMPARSKVIVWTHNVHAAKSFVGVEGLQARIPLGAHVRKDYGERSYALGFSALSGQYASAGAAVKDIPTAPPTSIEAQALATNSLDARFIGKNELNGFGRVPAAIHYYAFREGDWGRSFDGLYVFRREQAPQKFRD